jgi:threonine dehydrogenase-like Zn-dependent dehydrogenase
VGATVKVEDAVRAVLITGPGSFEMVHRPVPEVPKGMTLTAPAYVGLCGTDLDVVDGSMMYLHQGLASYPIQLGHEWSGTTLDPGVLPAGSRVIMDPIVGCGVCRLCASGRAAGCPDRLEIGLRNGLDGAMASAIAVHSDKLIPVPGSVSLRDAALVEPMVTTLEGIARTSPRPGEEVLVVGAGTLGLVGAMVLSARGFRTHVLLRNTARAETVEAAGGIPWLAGTKAAVDRFDVVIEAGGTPEAVQVAVEHADIGGRVALLGVPTSRVEVDAAGITVGDITVFGVHNGPCQFENGLAVIASGEVDPGLLIDRVYPLDDVGAALSRSRQPGRARPKVLIQVDPHA